MVGVVIATHGSLAEGLRSGVELLVGPQRQLETVGLYHGNEPSEFEEKVSASIRKADEGDGALCLVDMLGGTPSNVVMRLMQSGNVRALAGVNLPAVIQAVFMRESLGLEELARETFAAQRDAVIDLSLKIPELETPAKQEREQERMEPGDAPPIERGENLTAPGNGEVVLCRVDDRLIHGQVMTSWLNATGANKIMIVDDETSQNPFLKSVFKSAVPANVKVGVFNEAKAVDRLIKGFKPTDRVIVLAKYPQTFLSLVERGASLRQVIIGGMGAREDRSRLYRNISASQDERAALRALVDEGVDVAIQILADDAQVSVSKLL